jgi:hypothetical protein
MELGSTLAQKNARTMDIKMNMLLAIYSEISVSKKRSWLSI